MKRGHGGVLYRNIRTSGIQASICYCLFPKGTAHHSSPELPWLLLMCVPGDAVSHREQAVCTNPKHSEATDAQQSRALLCICVTAQLRSIFIISLVSSTLLQPEWTKDKELPVETHHKMLEVIQEALQNIRCNFLTRGSPEQTLQQQQHVPSVTHTSCQCCYKWVHHCLNPCCSRERCVPSSQPLAGAVAAPPDMHGVEGNNGHTVRTVSAKGHD